MGFLPTRLQCKQITFDKPWIQNGKLHWAENLHFINSYWGEALVKIQKNLQLLVTLVEWLGMELSYHRNINSNLWIFHHATFMKKITLFFELFTTIFLKNNQKKHMILISKLLTLYPYNFYWLTTKFYKMNFKHLKWKSQVINISAATIMSNQCLAGKLLDTLVYWKNLFVKIFV